ncbi:hypothetical protein F5Y14DRAFT_447356 [Nemania sp. NC0429]|nr:hypothetical protein F5Y14DRAFT_447356 [Nemania sp. NC0429]
MFHYLPDDDRPERSITPADQLQPVQQPAMPTQSGWNDQLITGSSSGLEATGHQVEHGGSHLFMVGIQTEAGNEYGFVHVDDATTGNQHHEVGNEYDFGQADQAIAGIQSQGETYNQMFDISQDARVTGWQDEVMQDALNTQNDNSPQGDEYTPCGGTGRNSVQNDALRQAPPIFQLDVSRRNPSLDQPEATMQAQARIARRRNGGSATPGTDAARAASPENTCLWIARLSAGCTVKDIFPALAGCGKVISVTISEADLFYDHKAANVVFWDHRGVEALLAMVHAGDFLVKGVRPIVRFNRFLGTSQEESYKSRVVVVAGPDSVVTRNSLEHQAFDFDYELEDVITRVDLGWWRCLEYRFASVRQAEDAVEAVRHVRERPGTHPMIREDWKEVKVRFGDDPCETGSHGTYGI